MYNREKFELRTVEDIKADIGFDVGKEGKIEIVFVDAKAPFDDEIESSEMPVEAKLLTKPGDKVQ